jgi:hypothetical protein
MCHYCWHSLAGLPETHYPAPIGPIHGDVIKLAINNHAKHGAPFTNKRDTRALCSEFGFIIRSQLMSISSRSRFVLFPFGTVLILFEIALYCIKSELGVETRFYAISIKGVTLFAQSLGMSENEGAFNIYSEKS